MVVADHGSLERKEVVMVSCEKEMVVVLDGGRDCGCGGV